VAEHLGYLPQGWLKDKLNNISFDQPKKNEFSDRSSWKPNNGNRSNNTRTQNSGWRQGNGPSILEMNS